MQLQIFPTYAQPGNGSSCYPMLYYAPQWQPNDLSQQHHPQHLASQHHQNSHQGHYDHDPNNASFLAMPTLAADQPPLYYTLGPHGNIVLLTPSNPQANMTPLSSSTHSDLVNEPEHIQMLLNSTRSDGSLDSQTSDPTSSYYDIHSRSLINASMAAVPVGATPTANRKSNPLKNTNKSPAYKTMLCNMFSLNRSCSYGAGCQYAHGKEEIRPCLPHPKYKTQLCNKFNSQRGCQYGDKCHFRHPDDPSPEARTGGGNTSSSVGNNNNNSQRNNSYGGKKKHSTNALKDDVFSPKLQAIHEPPSPIATPIVAPPPCNEKKKNVDTGTDSMDNMIKLSMFQRFESYVGKNRKATTLKRSNSCNTIGLYTFQRYVAMQDILKNRIKPSKPIKSQSGKRQTKPSKNQAAIN